ncbi:hypothetical protein PGT21_024125 [Puccinia graminis f. sp. tritici]|uniref:Uncharacterized protein n=1 Tax=Puccinia graminis f. sp. tritici TaxID=56615 RepID=A0A5B0LP77_PUCGR|nr:hypothetical protein PGT21_024125 [Puccinia graminis f. sp. tritici]KAA1072658.1 hypothetical protein PGTUg99_010881 [Puccinia graminis f. sp. tritici]
MPSSPVMASLGPAAGSPAGDSGEISGTTQHQSRQSQGNHRKNSDDDLAYALKASKEEHERHESDIAQSLEEALVRSLMDESRRSYEDAVLPDALSDAELAQLLESTREYYHDLGLEEQNLTCVLEMSKKEDLDRELQNSLRQALQLSLEESLSRQPHDQPHDHVEPSTSPNQNTKRAPPTPTVPQNGARSTSRREFSPLQRSSLADHVKDSIFALAKCLLVGYLLIFYCETFLFSVK